MKNMLRSLLLSSTFFLPVLNSNAQNFFSQERIDSEQAKQQFIDPNQIENLKCLPGNLIDYQRAKELRQRLGDEGIKLPSISQLGFEIQEFDEYTLDKIVDLKQKRIESNLWKRTNVFSEGFIGRYAYLLEIGVPLETLVELPEFELRGVDLREFYDGFKSGRISKDFIKHFSNHPKTYSDEIARENPFYCQNLCDMKCEIYNSLKKQGNM